MRSGRDAIGRLVGGSRPFAEAAGIVVERGEGVYLYGPGGARYLDAVSGFGVASLGHSHPRWVQAVATQAATLAVAATDTSELERFLECLAAVLPDPLQHIALYSGGAEAVEAAVRLAQRASGKAGLLVFEDGFHGKTLGVRYTRNLADPEALELGPPWLRAATFPACRQHDACTYPNCEENGSEVLAALAQRADLDGVGAVLVEPIQGDSGQRGAGRGFLACLRELCDQRGWLLLLDESITGFGRTGELFAFEYYAVRPDAVILSKGLGGGFPLSAVCAREPLWKASDLAGGSGTTTAFGGNPLACAAGRATLEILQEDGFLDGVRNVATFAARRLCELDRVSSRIARPRGVGLMLGFDLVARDTDAAVGPNEAREVMRACRDRGVLLAAHVPSVRIMPPLTIAEEDVERLFDVLAEVLA